MTDQSHIYKMAYSQLETALHDLIDASYDKIGKPRIPPQEALDRARQCLPEDRRPKVAKSTEPYVLP